MDIGSLTGQVAIEDQLSDKLTVISSHVKDFASKFDGMAGAVIVGAGAITAAITGMVISVVALGQKGSIILGVEDAFDKLARTAGSTGDAMVGALSEGVRGTIDSMELMQATTKLLSSGLKIGTNDMRLMAQTAREMGKASGTDAADGLNILSNAMTTGNAKSLKRYGIQIDLVAAEKEFRTSLGGTTDALSAAGKLEVNRIAVLEGMRVKMALLGQSSLSFKERIQQLTVSVGDWGDSLAKSIASSPNILRAFDAISEAINKTFGGTGQTLLEWIVKWVNRFADAVTTYGPPIIKVIGNIRDYIIKVWEAVTQAWDLVPDWFKNLAKEAGGAAGAVYLTHQAFSSLTGGSSLLETVASFATITSGLRDFVTVAVGAVPAAIVQIKGLYNALSVFYLLGSFAGGGVSGGVAGILTGIGAGISALAATPAGIAVVFTALGAAIWQVVGAIRSFGDNWKAGGGTLWGFLSLKDDDNFVRRWLGLSTAVDGVAAALERANKAGKLSTDSWGNQHTGGTKGDINLTSEVVPALTPSKLPTFTIPDTSAYDSFVKSIKELGSTLDSAAAHHMPLTQQVKLYGDAAAKAAEEAAGWGVKVTGSIQKIANAANDKAFKSYQDSIAVKPLTQIPGAVVDSGITAYIKMLDDRKAADKSAAAEHLRQTQATYDADIAIQQHTIADTKTTLAQKLTATEHYYTLLHQKATDSYTFERKKIVDSVDDQVKALDKGVSGWQDLEEAIRRAGNASTSALDADNGVTQLKIDLDQAAAAADTLGEMLGKTLSSIPDTLRSAFEGGGGITGALKSIAVQFGENFGKAMSEAIAKSIKTMDPATWEMGSGITGRSVGLAAAGGALAGGSAAASGASTGQQVGAVASAAAGAAQMAKMAGATNAASGALAAYTAAAGLAVVAGVAIWKAMHDGTKAMQDFYKTFVGGSDGLRQAMLVLGDTGEMMWKQLTQKTGKGDKEGADRLIAQIKDAIANAPATLAAAAGYQTRDDLQKIADKAKEVYDYMVASGKYTAESIADAFQKSKDATIAAMGDEGRAHQDAMDEITKRYDTLFEKIDTEYKTLSDSVAAEAEEAVKGSIQIQDEARLVQLAADRAALEEKKKQEETTANASYDAWIAAGKTADEALRELFKQGYDAPIHFKPDEMPDRATQGYARGGMVEYFASGGNARGTDTVPAMLTPGEGVLSLKGMSMLEQLNAGVMAKPTTGTPGIGSTVGAFMHLAGGGWVPKDHPLYLAEQALKKTKPVSIPTPGRIKTFGDTGGGSTAPKKVAFDGDLHITLQMPDGAVLLREIVKAKTRVGA